MFHLHRKKILKNSKCRWIKADDTGFIHQEACTMMDQSCFKKREMVLYEKLTRPASNWIGSERAESSYEFTHTHLPPGQEELLSLGSTLTSEITGEEFRNQCSVNHLFAPSSLPHWNMKSLEIHQQMWDCLLPHSCWIFLYHEGAQTFGEPMN